MLPKKHRIQRSDFDTFFKKSRPYHGTSLTMRIGEASSDTPTQASVVISKKVIKGAVMRHIVKRRIYSILRPYIQTLPPSSIIVIAKKGGDWGFSNLENEIQSLIAKAFPSI